MIPVQEHAAFAIRLQLPAADDLLSKHKARVEHHDRIHHDPIQEETGKTLAERLALVIIRRVHLRRRRLKRRELVILLVRIKDNLASVHLRILSVIICDRGTGFPCAASSGRSIPGFSPIRQSTPVLYRPTAKIRSVERQKVLSTESRIPVFSVFPDLPYNNDPPA